MNLQNAKISVTRMSTGLACTPSRARALYSPAFPRPRNLCIARRACANSNRVPMKTQHMRAFSIQSCLHTVNQNMPALSQEATRRMPCAIEKKRRGSGSARFVTPARSSARSRGAVGSSASSGGNTQSPPWETGGETNRA